VWDGCRVHSPALESWQATEVVPTLSLLSPLEQAIPNFCPHHRPSERITCEPGKQFLAKTAFLRAMFIHFEVTVTECLR
jgi:hypothetical protein